VPLVDELPEEGTGGGPLPNLVTITSFDNPMQADILASRLEAEGIEAFVSDAEAVSVNPLWSPAIGGVKVQVREGDARKALEISREKAPPKPEDPEDPRRPCPRCGSRETYKEEISRQFMALSILLLGFPLLFVSEEWKCSKCCRTFK